MWRGKLRCQTLSPSNSLTALALPPEQEACTHAQSIDLSHEKEQMLAANANALTLMHAKLALHSSGSSQGSPTERVQLLLLLLLLLLPAETAGSGDGSGGVLDKRLVAST